MIQDVIDLRQNKWIVLRPNDIKPKLITNIEDDPNNEDIIQSMARESYKPGGLQDHCYDSDNKLKGGKYVCYIYLYINHSS